MKKDITVNAPAYCDILVWDLTSVAHKLLVMNEQVKSQYPELIPFLEHLVKTYPATVKSK
jgi:hypothetical protein